MAILKNARHERFAQAMARGMTLEKAHRKAGYAGDRGTANVLQKRPDVSRRIEELRKKAEADLNLGREDFIRDIRDRFKKLPPELPVTAKYGEMLAKAQGWNEPERVKAELEISVKIGG